MIDLFLNCTTPSDFEDMQSAIVNVDLYAETLDFLEETTLFCVLHLFPKMAAHTNSSSSATPSSALLISWSIVVRAVIDIFRQAQ